MSSCKLRCTSRLHAILAVLLLFCYAPVGTVYYVKPKFNAFYSCNDQWCSYFNATYHLMHFVEHSEEYFTTNTQLHLLPGEHHLRDDIVIQDVVRFTIAGVKHNGKIATTINCSSPAGIAVVNSWDIVVLNLKMINCANNFTRFLDKKTMEQFKFFDCAGLFVLTSWNISIVEVYLSQGLGKIECGIQVLNMLGRSIIRSTKTNCLIVSYYDFVDNPTNVKNVLFIENHSSENTASVKAAIRIILFEFLDNIKISLHNTSFSDISATAFRFDCLGFQHQSIINITGCDFTDIREVNLSMMKVLLRFYLHQCYNKLGKQSEFYLNNCRFSNISLQNEKGTVIDFLIDEMNEDPWLNIWKSIIIAITHCKFFNNHNLQIMSIIRNKSLFGFIEFPLVKIKNIKINYLKLIEDSCAMFLHDTMVHFEGPNFLSYIESSSENSEIISITGQGFLQFESYFEISYSAVETVFNTSCVYIKEYSILNFTANTIDTLIWNDSEEHFSFDPVSILVSPKILMPCIFQYTSSRGNLDIEFNANEKLNYFILLSSNSIRRLSHYKYGIVHCGWERDSAYTRSNPRFVNQKIIHYLNESQKQIRKDICFCDSKHVQGNCFKDELGKFYPGETVHLYFIISNVPKKFKRMLVNVEDGLEPACSSDNKAVPTELSRNVCMPIRYAIKHKSGKECDLYLKAIPVYDIGHSVSTKLTLVEMYHVKLSACPVGFTLLDGSCKCDSILHSTVYACDINYQTVLRHANSWISGKTVNNSHSYSVSEQCPFDYCLPYASHINLIFPDSQCQFNRTGLLCGQCQPGLSAVFSSSECKHCSNMYLFLIIPFGTAGVLLVMSVFILNLTVRDGDINSFLFYVNIVSINAPIFLPNPKKYEYTFISLANLDLGITTCFYNGMDDYAKVWLQLAFPLYLIVIAVVIIIASRHSLRVLRLTANKGVSVLATLFVMSYTKVLCTLSNALFLYSKITNLPSAHSFQVWGVNTDIPIFSLKFSIIFCGFGLLLLLLALFNATLLFARILNFKLLSQLKYLLYYVCQAAYKDKYFYWTGLQLMLRAVFLGLSALDRNINLMISSLLIGAFACFHATAYPFKNKLQNIQELFMLMNLHALFITSLYSESNYTAVEVLISLSALYFFMIIVKHMRNYSCKRFYEDKFLCKAKELTTKIAKKLTAKTEMGNNMELLVGVNNNNCNEF